jgi:hypothetical protein
LIIIQIPCENAYYWSKNFRPPLLRCVDGRGLGAPAALPKVVFLTFLRNG